MVNENTGGSTTNVDLFFRAGAIYTLGKGEGVARPKFITGTTTGTVIKTSPGKLESALYFLEMELELVPQRWRYTMTM